MALGKKELMAAVVIGVVGAAAAVHFFIFQQKAETYARTSQEYKAAADQLANAEFIKHSPEFDHTAEFEQFKQETTRYQTLATSVVAELNLQKLHLDATMTTGAVDQWASQTITLLDQLNQRRQGQVRLTFLEKNGWDFPASLPANLNSPAVIQDRMVALITAYRGVQAARDVNPQFTARRDYNAALEQLGLPAQEVSMFYLPTYRFFFSSHEWLDKYMAQNRSTVNNGDLRQFYNYYGLLRFGQAVPALKKIWLYTLITRAMQGQNVDPGLLAQFGEALEIGIPVQVDEPLNSINKQLRALLDIIDTAGRTQVQDIQYVAFMRPVNVAKALIREPGATPPAENTPAATPDPMMGMGGMGMDFAPAGPMGGLGAMGGAQGTPAPTPVPDADAVGTGSGIEIWARAANANLVRFYYDLTHKTATYGLDDIYVHNQQGTLLTTATIEVITNIRENGSASAGASAEPTEGMPQ